MATLDIDGAHRYKLVAEICARLGVDEESTVLDIGGGTGRLVQYLNSNRVFTLDPNGDGEHHIRASMESIPLPTRSYDVVVQIDSLEHVPAQIREKSLLEMVRVAGKHLIWVGPVHSDLTAEVEHDLCASHRQLFGGKEMEWLSEHEANGLPEKDLVLNTLSEGFAESVSWMSFPLRRWWTFMRLDQQLEAGMFQPELEKEIDRWYETCGWKFDYRVSVDEPGYRFVFVGSKEGELPEGIEKPPEGLLTLDEWKRSLPLIEAIALSSPIDSEGQPIDSRFEEHIQLLRDQIPPNRGAERKNPFWKRLLGG